jgi:hypothetical protein
MNSLLTRLFPSTSAIQEQIASGDFPADDYFEFSQLGAFGELRGLQLGKLLQADEVLIADALMFHNKLQSSLELEMKDSSITVIAYCEPLGQTDSAQNDIEMLTDKPDSPRPRVLAILSSALSPLDLSGDEYSVDNWSSQILTWRTSRIATEISECHDLGWISRATRSSNASASSSRKFCTQCGVQFLKPDQKFCQMCGTAAV